MEWWWNDPTIGEQTQWWTIDPQTGEPDDAAALVGIGSQILGECPLWAAGESANAIEVTFGASRCFSSDETRALLTERIVPRSFRGGHQDAAELLELVESLWAGVDRCYPQAWGRSPTEIERHWLTSHAIATSQSGGSR